MVDEIGALDATAQAELVRAGQLSALELVDAGIARVEKLNGELNAVIHPLFDEARDAASALADRSAPFAGVPIVVKDLDGPLAGAPFHMGTRYLKRHHFVADQDSFLFAKLKAAGFVVIGKSNTPEFGLAPTTEPLSYGATHNPWDTTRSPGGSSGGSGAAVASGMVPIAHAADGGGSIRIPASECGIVGLKTSRGRISSGPDSSESWGGCTVRFAVTRTVRDTAALLDVAAGAMPGDYSVAPPPARPYVDEVGADPGRLRIGVRTLPFAAVGVTHPDCVAAVEAAAKLLESLGHIVEPGAPDGLDDSRIIEGFLPCFTVWTAGDVDQIVRMVGQPLGADDIEPETRELAEFGRAVSGVDLQGGLDLLRTMTRVVAPWWQDHDLLLTPTITEPPPPLGSFRGTANPRATQLVPFTLPFNVTGQPAISLPLHWNDDGLPIGVQLVAAYGREDVLLRVAAQLEAAQPWTHRRPPVSA